MFLLYFIYGAAECGIEPKKHGGGTKTKIDNHGFAVIEQMIQQKPDLIFSELCQLLKEKTGVKVSKSSMYRYVRKLNMSRKKKSISQ